MLFLISLGALVGTLLSSDQPDPLEHTLEEPDTTLSGSTVSGSADELSQSDTVSQDSKSEEPAIFRVLLTVLMIASLVYLIGKSLIGQNRKSPNKKRGEIQGE